MSTTVVTSKTAALKRPRLSPPVQLGIAVAVVVLIAVAGWFLVVSPKKSTASDLETQIADAQLRLTQARVDANRKPVPPVETSPPTRGSSSSRSAPARPRPWASTRSCR